jgi:hypothetical protein
VPERSTSAAESPCQADLEKHCKDVVPGQGRTYACLKSHEKDLSEACKKHIGDVQKNLRGVHDACWDDASRLCKDTPRGRGRVLACLKAHESELSEGCRGALAPAPKK